MRVDVHILLIRYLVLGPLRVIEGAHWTACLDEGGDVTSEIVSNGWEFVHVQLSIKEHRHDAWVHVPLVHEVHGVSGSDEG